MSDIEYSVIKSDVIKSFDCICFSSDFHQVLELCLKRGFAKLMDHTAENYKQFQRTNCPSLK